uniref:Uncharacterized protein n=1 Tax=Arundo donax TaxID=35708 RepID=A0A0A9BAW9_ARUDO
MVVIRYEGFRNDLIPPSLISIEL